MKVLARCVHHQPKQGSLQTCALGVRTRDVYERGIGPCVTLEGRPDRRSACSKYEGVPPEQIDAEARETEELLQRFLAGKCPQCGADLQQRENASVIFWICPTHGGVARGCKRIGEEGADA